MYNAELSVVDAEIIVIVMKSHYVISFANHSPVCCNRDLLSSLAIQQTTDKEHTERPNMNSK